MRVLQLATTMGAAVLLALTAGGSTASATAAVAKSPLDYEREFAAWMADHHLTFHDALEYAKRLENYIRNDLVILRHNANPKRTFTLGHNQYSHLTLQEFKQRMTGLRISPAELEKKRLAAQRKPKQPLRAHQLPDSVDWVAKGGVTPVKNQGQCGSCWAFSTTGAVEGAAFVSSGKLLSLSEQELVDCDDNGDMGCNGGLMDHAFEWIEGHRGLCAEDEYEYKAKQGVCRTCHEVVKVTGYQDVDPNDEQALQAAVAQQPVSVAIEADQVEFQLYKSGVFDAKCGTQLDHGVLVVGYGEEDGKKYWKVKNSWGDSWGEKGYIRLAREIGAQGTAGQCGVAMAPSYPFASIIKGSQEVPAANKTTTVATPVRDSSAKISQCGDKSKSVISFDDLEITPKNPKRGKPITFYGNGQVKSNFDSAAFKIVVRLAGQHVFGHNGKLCGESRVPLPLGLGHIDVHGFQCPMKTGKFSDLKVDVNLPKIAPAGNYQIELHATTGQGDEDKLFCVNVELELEADHKQERAKVYELMAEM